MAHAVLYKYINCTVDKLLALALVTNYITNYSTRTTATATTIIIITIIMMEVAVSPPNGRSRAVAPDVIALWSFHIVILA